MKENIETKDVQRTEYLDKNGLDMLWAKVKENIHNQVEVERNRAVAKENSIVDTKADKSEFSNYVPSATFTALEKKVSANTAAISNKQNAGNYLHYETLNDEGYYEIPSVCISESDAKLKAILSPYDFQIVKGDLEGDGETGVAITSNDGDPYIALTDSAYENTLKITREGISNTDNNANHVYATDGSIADLTEYAKKTDVPEVDTSDFVSKTTTNDQSIKSKLSVFNELDIVDGSADNYRTTIRANRINVQGYGETSMLLSNSYLHFLNNNGTRFLSLDGENGEISISNTTSTALVIGKRGIFIPGSDNNHVLTAGNSTIDITQYVLKSVYDEKIAALEARIAALEAKHTETA